MSGIKLHPGGTFYNPLGTYVEYVEIYGGLGMVTNAGAIGSVGMSDGGTVINQIDATVSDVGISGGAGKVANAGTIGTVDLFDGGSITNQNSGTISGSVYGVVLQAGGAVTNDSGGNIDGQGFAAISIDGSASTVTNAGTISATGPTTPGEYSTGVILFLGGKVINEGDGVIDGTWSGVFVKAGAGAITNQAGAAISGSSNGVFFYDGPGAVTNSGAITATGAGGWGVYVLGGAGTVTNAGTIATTEGGESVRFAAGGTVDNKRTGTIGSDTAHASAVYITGGAGSVTNAGKISGTTDSVVFAGSGANTLTLQTGSTLTGAAVGSQATGAANTLVLQGTGTADNDFDDFNAMKLLASGSWTLGGDSTIGASTLGAGALVVTGNLTTALDQGASVPVTIGDGGTLTLTGTSTLRGATSGAGTLSLAGGVTAIDSGATISAAKLSITGAATKAAVDEDLGYAEAFSEGAGSTVSIALDDALTLTGTSALAGLVNGPGALDLAGGSTTIDAGARLTETNWSISGSGTSVTLDDALSHAGAFSEDAETLLSIAGGDALTLKGTSALSGFIYGLGKFDLAGGTATIDAGADLAMADWLISGSQTKVTLDEALAFTAVFTESAGATLDLAGGALTLTGAAVFNKAVVDGAKQLLTKGATTISDLTLGGTVVWTNSKTVTETSGNSTLGDGSGAEAILVNASTGTFDLTGDSGIARGASKASYINNAGKFEKTGVAGTSSAVVPEILNSGTIVAVSGTLDLQGTVAGTGKGQVDAGATLEFDGTVGAGQTINYSGSGGDLALDDLDVGGSQLFHGTISGWGTGANDELDAGAPFAFGATSFNFNTTTDMLMLSDGSLHASIHFSAAFSNGNFTPQDDLHGGTLFKYNPNP